MRDDDKDLIERIGNAYRPADSTPSARARFDEQLWSRIESRRRGFGLFVPAVASAALAAVLVWAIGVPNGSKGPTAPAPAGEQTAALETVEPAEADGWAYAVLFAPDIDAADERDTDDLPEFYRAVSEMLLEG